MGIHSAHEARYSRRAWCGESKEDETWLQVDLGKVKNIFTFEKGNTLQFRIVPKQNAAIL